METQSEEDGGDTKIEAKGQQITHRLRDTRKQHRECRGGREWA
jgi:hypothetical protein